MSERLDDPRGIENLLRSAGEDLAYPPEPDVRGQVRGRLDTLRAGSESAGPGSGNGQATENPDGDAVGDSREGARWREKSLRRQLLEMAAAVFVLIAFTGALALIYQAQTSDHGSSPAGNLPGDEPAGKNGGEDDRVTAIAYPRIGDDEVVLTLADIDGSVLLDVRDLPQDPSVRSGRPLHVKVSPDGTRIVFAGSGDDSGNLYIRDLESGEDDPLVADPDSDAMRPIWSPDGEWIAFESDRPGHQEIFVVRPDGSGVRQVTDTEDGGGLPVWSPDGERIAFLSPPSWQALGSPPDPDPSETPFAIHVVNRDGSGQRPVEGAEVSNPVDFVSSVERFSSNVWSPDGSQLAFTAFEPSHEEDDESRRLAIADVERESVRVVPDHAVIAAAWSPTDSRLAVVTEGSDGAFQLLLLEPGDADADATMLYESEELIHRPQWSPDGEHILLWSRWKDRAVVPELRLMDVETRQVRRIAKYPFPSAPVSMVKLSASLVARDTEAPKSTPTVISTGPHLTPDMEDRSTEDVTVEVPDDQRLALAVRRWMDDRQVMSVFDLEGSLVREFDEIPNIERDEFPPTIVADISPDGRSVVYQHDHQTEQSDIFLMDSEGEPRQLTTTGDNYRSVWSPDGERIAFLSDRAHGEDRHEHQRGEIFVMDADGSNLRQLSETAYGAGQIKWSHDGSMIAFASPGFHSAFLIEDGDPPEFPYQLYVVDVASGEQRELDGATMEHLAGFGLSSQPWLTDDSGVFFERHSQVFLATANGSGVEEVEEIPSGEENHQRWAAASPDGKSIAFNWTMADESSPIGILDLESGEARALGEELGSASHRDWSPDGAYLAARKGGERPDDYPEGLMYSDIWVVNPDDATTRRVATGVSGSDVRWVLVPRE